MLRDGSSLFITATTHFAMNTSSDRLSISQAAISLKQCLAQMYAAKDQVASHVNSMTTGLALAWENISYPSRRPPSFNTEDPDTYALMIGEVEAHYSFAISASNEPNNGSDLNSALLQMRIQSRRAKDFLYWLSLDASGLIQPQSEMMYRVSEKLVNDVEDKWIEFGSRLNSNNSELKHVLEQSEEILNEIRKTAADAANLAGEAARAKLAGGYMQSAAKSEILANNFRRLSLALMTLPIGVFLHSLYVGNSLSTPEIVSRISFFLAILIPITYTARESGKHRIQGERYERTALDLETSTPYLASLPEDLRNKTKAEVAMKIFFTAPNGSAQDSLPLNFQELLVKFLDKFTSNRPA